MSRRISLCKKILPMVAVGLLLLSVFVVVPSYAPPPPDPITQILAKLDAIEAKLEDIKTELTGWFADGGTIESYVDEVEDLLKHGTHGLSALNTDLDTLLSRLTDTRASNLDLIDDINTYLTGTIWPSVSAIETCVSDRIWPAVLDVKDLLENGDYGLIALDVDLNNILARLGSGPFPDTTGTIWGDIHRIWGKVDTEIDTILTDLTATNTYLREIWTDSDTLLSRLTAARASNLDLIDDIIYDRLGTATSGPTTIMGKLEDIKSEIDEVIDISGLETKLDDIKSYLESGGAIYDELFRIGGVVDDIEEKLDLLTLPEWGDLVTKNLADLTGAPIFKSILDGVSEIEGKLGQGLKGECWEVPIEVKAETFDETEVLAYTFTNPKKVSVFVQAEDMETGDRISIWAKIKMNGEWKYVYTYLSTFAMKSNVLGYGETVLIIPHPMAGYGDCAHLLSNQWPIGEGIQITVERGETSGDVDHLTFQFIVEEN